MDYELTNNVQFLTKAREALTDYEAAAKNCEALADEKKALEKSVASMQKEAENKIADTIKKKRNALIESYDEGLDDLYDKLKKAKARREKAKNKGVKSRIVAETADLDREIRQLKAKISGIFRQNNISSIFNNQLYFSLFAPKGIAELLTLLLTAAAFILLLPWIVYLCIPNHRLWLYWLLAAIFAAAFAGLYILIYKKTKGKNLKAVLDGRSNMNLIKANRKKIQMLEKSIRKSTDDSYYNLDKHDLAIKDAQNACDKLEAEKRSALDVFDKETRQTITDGITEEYKPKIGALQDKLGQLEETIGEADIKLEQISSYISTTFIPRIGRDYFRADRLEQLTAIIQDGKAPDINSAIQVYENEK